MHSSTASLSPLSFSVAAPHVRDAADADLSTIQAIYAHHVLHGLASFEEVPPGVDELRTRHAAVRAAGLPYLVAEVDGAVAGYAYATLYRPRSAYRHTVEDSVYVAHAWRGGVLVRRCWQPSSRAVRPGPGAR